MGDKVLATYKHMRWPAEREMWASCTLTPIFFLHLIYSQSLFFSSNTYIQNYCRIKQWTHPQHSSSEHARLDERSYVWACVASKYAVLRLFQDSQERHWSCRFSAWFQLNYNKRLFKNIHKLKDLVHPPICECTDLKAPSQTHIHILAHTAKANLISYPAKQALLLITCGCTLQSLSQLAE